MDEYIDYSMPIDDNDNVCDNFCPIAATGIQNNFIPHENDFVTPEQEINKIDKASHDVTSKRKGRPKKSGFKGTPRKKETTINSVIRVAESKFQENEITPESSIQISDNSTADVSNPIGLINHANDCFFNSAIQVLFSLKIFRDHVRNFDVQNTYTINVDEQNSHKMYAARSIKRLFRAIEEMKLKSNETRTLLMTHDYIRTLGLQGYEENRQFDAQECLSYIVDLFYPWVIDGSNNSNYGIPDNCLFLLDGEETIHCHKCNKYANKYFREAICQITFPHPDIEYSIQHEINEMINDSHGEQMDEKCECKHYNPIKTKNSH